MASLANPAVFVVAYVLVMLPTYLLPYFGSNSTAAAVAWHLARQAAGLSPMPFLQFWAHFLCLIALCVLTYIRGRSINKTWLLVFPFLALAFDLVPVLTWIPLVPTVMHLLAIILGVAVTQVATPPAAVAGR